MIVLKHLKKNNTYIDIYRYNSGHIRHFLTFETKYIKKIEI